MDGRTLLITLFGRDRLVCMLSWLIDWPASILPLLAIGKPEVLTSVGLLV